MALTTGAIVDNSTAVTKVLNRGARDEESDNAAFFGISGTYAGITFAFQGQTKGATGWYPVVAVNQATGAVVNGNVSPGTNATASWMVPAVGYSSIRMLPSAYTSGALTNTIEMDSGRFTNMPVIMESIAQQALAAGQVTLPKVDFSSLKMLSFDGANGAASTTLTGAAVGDRVIKIFGHVKANTGAHTFLYPATGDFETTISLINKIQQLQTDLSANTYTVLLAPAIS